MRDLAHVPVSALYPLNSPPQHLSGLTLNPAPGQTAFDITGRYHSIEKTTITGAFEGLHISGASDLVIDHVDIRNPAPKGGGGYCCYSTLANGPSSRVDVIGGTWEIDDKQDFAQFPFRGYGLRTWRFFNTTFINRGKAKKAALKLAECDGVEFHDCFFVGWPIGIGRNQGDPTAYLCQNIKFFGGVVDMNDHNPPDPPSLKVNDSVNVTFDGTKIIQRASVAVLDLWSDVTFADCTILGGSKLKQGNGRAISINSTYLGKPIP